MQPVSWTHQPPIQPFSVEGKSSRRNSFAETSLTLFEMTNLTIVIRATDYSRSWFDGLTASGLGICKVQYLAVHLEQVEGRTA